MDTLADVPPPNLSSDPVDKRTGSRAHHESVSDKADLVVVANRLSFDLEVQPDGETTARQAPGGLVTALTPILRRQHGAWIGWPGTPDVTVKPTEAEGVSLHPLTLSTQEVNDYYEGFSNGTLWPLYHDVVAEPEFHRTWWDAYEQVNRRFAEAAAEVAAPGATVWVHDYQLQLVPQLLRRLRSDVRIGFFLHIPFPPPELFLRLPRRAEIINGLLGADLIGFQLPGGARNFRRLARSLTGAATSGSLIEHDGRTVRAAAFPISIDSKADSALAATPQVRQAAEQLRTDLGNPRRLILGVDRLDYTKGINIRLRAFAELLAEGDPAVDDTVMVQIATPSRERLGSYIRTREEIERQVGAINGDHGKIGRPAVHYLHQSLPRKDLAAFYLAADVMAVTPLRDGMNLVAKEYVACRAAGGGVLLLSEFTGAARELRSAVLVNPYDTDGVKDALRTALDMPQQEARHRMRSLRRQVLTHDVNMWASAFLTTLLEHPDRVATAAGRLPAAVVRTARRVAWADRLLVATDFDGTLAPLVDDPAAARALPEALDALHALAALPRTSVAVVSGRSLKDLRALLGDTGSLHLIGSHGAEASGGGPPGVEVGGDGSPGAVRPRAASLAPDAARALTALTTALTVMVDTFPTIRLEPKPAGVAVHFRGADPVQAQRARAAIEEGIGTAPGVNMLHGKQVLELTVVRTDKGSALAALREELHCTAVVFIGDDTTDEHAFSVLGTDDLGVKVGPGNTVAGTRVDSPAAVSDLLRVMLSARNAGLGRRHRRKMDRDRLADREPTSGADQ